MVTGWSWSRSSIKLLLFPPLHPSPNPHTNFSWYQANNELLLVYRITMLVQSNTVYNKVNVQYLSAEYSATVRNRYVCDDTMTHVQWVAVNSSLYITVSKHSHRFLSAPRKWAYAQNLHKASPPNSSASYNSSSPEHIERPEFQKTRS